VDFTNTVIIMTSNVGSDLMLEMAQKGRTKELEQQMQERLRQYFKPEFLNRIDHIITFEAITPEMLGQIVELQLKQVVALLQTEHVELTVSPEAKQWLVEHGYDPAYGARPLRRLIQQEILDRVAIRMLEREDEEQVLNLSVNVANDQVTVD
jgi:ATP-dependent Clp protease ATP-binding subunit ClpA